MRTTRLSHRGCSSRDRDDTTVFSAFPFDPGQPLSTLSEVLKSIDSADGDIIVDTGAGRGIKPTTDGLSNPVPSTSTITWGDGTLATALTEASLPGHSLPPFLVTPKASCTLVSVGSNTAGTTECYTFFDKHAFTISGLQVYKSSDGVLRARFVGPRAGKVKYVASKPRDGGVYKSPSLGVFSRGEDGAWRFRTPSAGDINVIAGPQTLNPSDANIASVVDKVFAGVSTTTAQRHSISTILQQPDFVEAFEYTVADMTAHQQEMAMRLVRKHNAYGHMSRSNLRCVLQQSHVKADRELARHINLI